LARLSERTLAAPVRARMLQLVPAAHANLKLDLLAGLLKDENALLQQEAVRALFEHPDTKRFHSLREVAQDPRFGATIRAEAIVGLSDRAGEFRDELFDFIRAEHPVLRTEALRALIGVPLNPDQHAGLEELAKRRPESAPLTARVLGQPFTADRPSPGDFDAWLKKLEGPADVGSGRRGFFYSKLARCFRCPRSGGPWRANRPHLT